MKQVKHKSTMISNMHCNIFKSKKQNNIKVINVTYTETFFKVVQKKKKNQYKTQIQIICRLKQSITCHAHFQAELDMLARKKKLQIY